MRSRDESGELTLSGCQGTRCRYKAFQTWLTLDLLAGVMEPSERDEALKSILDGLTPEGIFGHVIPFGMTPEDLWSVERCDYFCSVKHWTVLVSLHHLLTARSSNRGGEPAPQ